MASHVDEIALLMEEAMDCDDDGFEWRTPKPANEQPPFNLMFVDWTYLQLEMEGKVWDSNPKYCTSCKATNEQYKHCLYASCTVKHDFVNLYKGSLVKINFQPVKCPDCNCIYTVIIDYKDGQIGLLKRGGNVINWSVVPCEFTKDTYEDALWEYKTCLRQLFIFDKLNRRRMFVINLEIIDKYTYEGVTRSFKLKDGGHLTGFRSCEDNPSTVFIDGAGKIVPYDVLEVLDDDYLYGPYRKNWPFVFKNEHGQATLYKDGHIEYVSRI